MSPARYGTALALSQTVLTRMDNVREAGAEHLARASEAARAESDRLVAEAEPVLAEAWAARGTGRGMTLAEGVEASIERALHLRALSDWLSGTDRRLDTSGGKFIPLSAKGRGYLAALYYTRSNSIPFERTRGVDLPEDFVDRRVYA